MSLERKDLRLKLDAEVHAALAVLADVDKSDMGELAERLIVDYVTRRVHDATVIAERLGVTPKSGNGGERTPRAFLRPGEAE